MHAVRAILATSHVESTHTFHPREWIATIAASVADQTLGTHIINKASCGCA